MRSGSGSMPKAQDPSSRTRCPYRCPASNVRIRIPGIHRQCRQATARFAKSVIDSNLSDYRNLSLLAHLQETFPSSVFEKISISSGIIYLSWSGMSSKMLSWMVKEMKDCLSRRKSYTLIICLKNKVSSRALNNVVQCPFLINFDFSTKVSCYLFTVPILCPHAVAIIVPRERWVCLGPRHKATRRASAWPLIDPCPEGIGWPRSNRGGLLGAQESLLEP